MEKENRRKDYRRQGERRAPKRGVTIRHDDEGYIPRRVMLQRSGLTLSALAFGAPVLLLPAKSCGSTTEYVKWSGVLIGSLKDVSPILADMGAGNVVALINQALPIAEKLKKAFQDNDNATTLAMLERLINPDTGLVVEIAAFVSALQSDERKRTVQGILALGMVALRLIQANAESAASAAGVTVETLPENQRATARAAKRKTSALELAFEAVRF